ncbi:hypothetical protein MJO28_012469 [Puccinia striiformis f. sp. tritici]|uniref:Uncharacterized protein n=1 Tax=Puccinia striiformis f. sp. tritici TaxID=168172 RepID=A0ACC0E0J7_9BASI|nr:hypothetical protein MJO28_012469 [Puccinia striiformis f. sp. tritici]KAI7945562.1 hypothetical protein MJO29_011950 [Puccinia striiformis f. sp. tritici]
MSENSRPAISTDTLVGIVVGVFGLVLLFIITVLVILQTRHAKRSLVTSQHEGFTGAIASKFDRKSESNWDMSNFSLDSPRTIRAHPLTAESNFDSAYHLPDIHRFSAPSSIGQAVHQAFRKSQMTPPQRVRPRSRTARAQQNGLIDQRPGWAQWFRRQTIQEPFFSVQSSFSSGESPLASVQPFGESRSQLSLSIFPSPPPQRSSQRAHSSNVRSLLEHSGSSEILMYGDENRGSYTPGVVCPTTNVPPNYHEIALPCSAYPRAESFTRMSTSTLLDSPIDPAYLREISSPSAEQEFFQSLYAGGTNLCTGNFKISHPRTNRRT